jgi:hypothetical protein
MSIETLTGDEFADLTPQEHDEALALYADAVSTQARQLPSLEPHTVPHEDCLDKMARLLTLRKVHQVRRQEQEDDEQFTAGRSVAAQYQENERNPHLVS